MAGLSIDGFEPLGYDEIVTRIQDRLEAYNPGFDFSPESPDGQLVGIFAYELSQAWQQLDAVYRSYDPAQATGAGLRNLGLLTGLPYGVASRSAATAHFDGIDGTAIPSGTLVTDNDGNEFATQFDTQVPAAVQVVATTAGALPVDAGTIKYLKNPITGVVTVTQPDDGYVGSIPETEAAYRNSRNRTVLRNFSDTLGVMSARLFELGIPQVDIVNNDQPTPDADGVPANTIHPIIGEIAGDITDEEIGEVILATKSLGCPTFGTTTVSVPDSQGHYHDVSFSKATPVDIYFDIEVIFHSDDYAGAKENIQDDLELHINNLLTGEDVIWSRLFSHITPYAESEVQKLEISTDGTTWVTANIEILANQYARTDTTKINVTHIIP